MYDKSDVNINDPLHMCDDDDDDDDGMVGGYLATILLSRVKEDHLHGA